MFREEVEGYSAPPRPQRKATPWILMVLVVLAGLGLAHMAGLTRLFTSQARQSSSDGSRNLRTPATRLIGEWRSDDDPMFRRVCHSAPEKPKCETGLYMAESSRNVGQVIYKIESEDRSGTELVMGEYLPGADLNYRVHYSIAKDGLSMTRGYDDRNGRHVSSHYRYVGPPTESIP